MNAMKPIKLAPLGQLELGLNIPEDATFEEWASIGPVLRRGLQAVNWLIGDWMIAGRRFGDRGREEAQRIFLSDVERFDPIIKTCEKFPEDRRHSALSFTHHAAVAKLDDSEADALLAEAERDRMTTAMLRAKVKVIGGQRAIPIEDDDPEDTLYRSGVQCLNRLPRKVRDLVIEAFVESKGEVVDL